MTTLTFIRNVSDMFTGTAKLFKVEAGLPIRWKDDSEEHRLTDYIVVSASTIPWAGPETLIFPANEEGIILDWLDLEGSQRGTLDIDAVLLQAGYDVVYPQEEKKA